MSALPEYSLSEVAKHASKKDLWLVVKGKVYDVTAFSKSHPGGPELLEDEAGTDASESYEDVGHSSDADEILQKYLIGTLKQ